MKPKDEYKSCRFYAIVLYETEKESKVIYTSKSQPNATRAGNLAVEHIKKHKQLMIERK